MKHLLLLKFPYSSSFGGGEQHTLAVFDAVQRAGGQFTLLTSCRVLRKEFRARHWPVVRWWMGKEPVAAWSLALFPLTLIPVFLGILLALLYYRVRHGTRTLYCLSFTEKVVATPVARLLGMRVVWMEHVAPGRWLRKNPLRLVYVLWSRLARVVVVSRHLQEEYQAVGVPVSRLLVIYHGIDLAPYERLQRRTFHWDKRFTIGTIARLEPEKGVAHLLRAFQRLLISIPYARLIIVGDGSERKELEWLARQLAVERSVQFVGFQRNVAAWLSSFDCFVLPSVKRESFGIVLLEAMASGCPVVASDLGGIPEAVRNNQDGILVEPGDTDLLNQALLYLYNHPDVAMELSRRARARVHEHFTSEKMATAFLGLLRTP